MHLLHPLDGAQNHARIARVDSAVAIQIVHPAVAVVVDEHVGRITVHVSAQLRAAAGTPAVAIVPGRAEAAHHRHVLNRDTCLLEIRDHQLELVDEILVEDQILRPDVSLIMRQEIGELEMLRDLHVLVI